MTHIVFVKKAPFHYIPGDPATEEYDHKIKIGQSVHADFKRMRNPKFHRKFFALLNIGFEYWEPELPDDDKTYFHLKKYGRPQKSFDVFREHVTILAGFHESVFKIDGTFKLKAKSISFAKMDEDTFSDLYQKVITVLMNRIPMIQKMGEDEVNRIVNHMLEFS